MDSNYYDRLAGVDTKAIMAKKYELLEQTPQEMKDKYSGKSGIYGIYIDDKLVYIGHSTNMLWRWLGHQINIYFDFGQHDYREDKYRIFREALAASHSVSCKIVEEYEGSKAALEQKERNWINKMKPIMNIEFACNKIKNATLKDILG